MISWMQKHNKYLVWTIWVATIAFIGAGFVGWGSYDFGSKAGNVAKIGNIEISQPKLNRVYSNVYNQYNEMLQGKLDDKKAEEMGLIKQAFATLATQAKILNFAQDLGIIVSDEEVAEMLEGIKGFQKDGQFNKEIYDTYLQRQKLKAYVFETMLREDIIINKTLALLQTKSLPLEEEAVAAAMNIADKISYKVLSLKDIQITPDDIKIKAYWEMYKENYMTDKKYILSIVWTQSQKTEVTEDELKVYHSENRFNYTDKEGKQLSYEASKENVIKDLKLKKTKKTAQKNYIAFKKDKLESTETLTLAVNDPKLTAELWKEIQQRATDDTLKPKIVSNAYAIVKIDGTDEAKIMSFEEAKEEVTVAFISESQKKELSALAESTLKNLDESNATVSNFITLETSDKLKALNPQESLQFVQKLFTSSKEKGTIRLSDKVVVYNIIEQKISSIDSNQTDLIKETVNQLKERILETNLIKMLDKKYPTEVYMGGLTN